jgi:hypothetical protein
VIETELVRLDDEREDEYEAFLVALPEALLYYSSRYRHFLESLLGCRSEYWLAVRGNEIVGVLPTMALDADAGTVVNSLPYYGSNGGVLAVDVEAHACLVAHWNELVHAPGVVAATWVSHPVLQPKESEIVHTDLDERLAGFTSVPKTENELLSIIDGSARRNVKKAERSGVTTTVDNEAWAFLEAVHLENMAAISGNPKEHAFFELLPAHFDAGSDYRIYTASVDGEVVAALLLLYFAGTVEYFTPVTRHDARTLQPMSAILRHALLDSAIEGFRRWNWGGTWSTQDGVGRFKRKWGAEFTAYRYYVQINDDSLRGAPTERLLSAWPGFYVLPFGKSPPATMEG